MSQNFSFVGLGYAVVHFLGYNEQTPVITNKIIKKNNLFFNLPIISAKLYNKIVKF
jgi:hypothetical protein